MEMLWLQYTVTLALAIFASIKAFNWKKSSLQGRFLAVLSIVAAILVFGNAIIGLQKKQLIEKIEATYTVISNNQPSNNIILQIGRPGAQFRLGSGVFFSDYLGEPLFKLFIRDRKLYINTVLYDKSGKAILAIFENECTRYSDDFEYNNDENGYEVVVKGSRDVYFQVDLVDGIAYMAGLFYSKTTGKGASFCPAEGEYIGKGSIMKFEGDTLRGPALLCKSATRLFKYPRQAHFRERN